MAVLIWIVGVIVVIFILYFIATYNRFVNLKNGIESNIKQINVALKKRLDLIDQVVSSVKGQMKFEKGTLTEVTKLRSAAKPSMDAAAASKVAASSQKILAGLQVQVEAYPNLKSNEQVAQLIQSINGLEDEIGRLRYVYNNTVQEFNTKVQTIPSNIIAAMSGFGKNTYLEFAEGQEKLEKAPKIEL